MITLNHTLLSYAEKNGSPTGLEETPRITSFARKAYFSRSIARSKRSVKVLAQHSQWKLQMNMMHNDVQQIERQAGLEIILQLWLIY